MYKYFKMVFIALTSPMVLMICFLLAFSPEFDGHPQPLTAAIILTIYGAVLYAVLKRRDRAPDFLARISKRYYDRGGLCFLLGQDTDDCLFPFVVYYQNRYERPCDVVIQLSEALGLLSGEKPFEVKLAFSCAGGAFGKATITKEIPVGLQGHSITYKIKAGVKYPRGRGGILRYRDGLPVGTLSGQFELFLFLYMLLNRHWVIHPAAKINYFHPEGIPELEEEITLPLAKNEVYWKLGDARNFDISLPNWEQKMRPSKLSI